MTFGLVLLAATGLYLYAGRQHWFYLDEYDFLAQRRATNVDDLLRPHYEHWTTLPVLVYRALWSVFGLHTYLPYRLTAVLVHVVAAGLLYAVMRRQDISPWIATVAASAFALLGAADMNILWAFQITFTGAFALGLTHLLLADHEGPVSRKDWLGLLAGLGALMCSGIGVAMVAIVGLAVLLRRGWRLASFHVVPLALLFAGWWAAYGREGDTYFRRSFESTAGFVWSGLEGAFRAVGQSGWVALALVALLAAGAVSTVRAVGHREMVERHALPLAMLAGSGLVLTMVALGRAAMYGSEHARTGRYLYLVAGLALPAVAFGADAVARRWPLLAPAAVLVLVIGIPGNIDATLEIDREEQFRRGNRNLIVALAGTPTAESASRDLAPLGMQGPDVTIGWLVDSRAEGKIPVPPGLVGDTAHDQVIRQGLVQVPPPAVPPPAPPSCRDLRRQELRTLAPGDRIHFQNGMLRVRDATGSPGLVYLPQLGNELRAERDMRVWLSSEHPAAPARLCG